MVLTRKSGVIKHVENDTLKNRKTITDKKVISFARPAAVQLAA